jgi:predicted enzyme related to lactoylglutathione lyase
MPVKSNVQLKTLSYVIVYVKDTTKALPFYTEKLGMTVKSNEDGWVELEAGQTTFALHGNKEFKPVVEGVQTTPVFNVDDFDGTYEALKQDGVKFLHEPMQVCEAGPGKIGMSAEFKDTDGNTLSIFGIVSK